ncbi:MAG: hypothetical protein GX557_02050 [Chloroflexi bacterium]|nr:hypothetical protein [Chloroflexota bacterium]
MGRVEQYRATLRSLGDWLPCLRSESHLPGPRGNLELAEAVALEGDERLYRTLLTFRADVAPVNTPDEFLFFCGVLGLGVLLAAGNAATLPELRRHANDPRWRTREAVAMALQRYGRADWTALYAEMRLWAGGSLLERRAAVAALCEPDLLADAHRGRAVLQLLDRVTRSLLAEPERRSEAFGALRRGLGYCWSVAMVASPEDGKAAFEALCPCEDRDVRWVLRENLKKNRLLELDAAWVAELSGRLGKARGQ